jgi:hypothetical protein
MNVAALPAAVPPLPLPIRTAAWEALLARSPAAANLSVLCSTLWTEEILEVLSCSEVGRFYLHKTGKIGEFPRDSVHGRIVHATPGMVRAWHWKRALRPIGSAGTHGCRFMFTDGRGSDRLIFPYPFQEKAPAQ